MSSRDHLARLFGAAAIAMVNAKSSLGRVPWSAVLRLYTTAAVAWRLSKGSFSV